MAAEQGLPRGVDMTSRLGDAGSPSQRPLPYHLVLLPAVPALMLWSGNASQLRSLYPLRIIAVSVGLALVVTLIASVVQRDVRRSALVGTLTVVVMSVVGYVLPDPTRAGLNLTALVLALAATVILSAKLGASSIRHITVFLNVIALALVVANGVVVVRDRPSGHVEQRSAALPPGGGDGRDVWYLVPDRYPPAPVLDEVGIAVDAFADGLEQRGFQVFDGVRANYPQTLLSLGSAWGLEYLGETDSSLSESDEASLRLADPLLGQLFDSAGYDYIHLGSWPEFTSTSRSADVVATFQGANEFYAAYEPTTILPSIRFLMDAGLPAALGDTRQLEHGEHQLKVLARLAATDPASPQFVLSHLVLPHGPYVFGADGSHVRPRADTPSGARAGYQEQVTFLNRRILSIVADLQDRDEPPIIIIMADEGLYPEDLTGQDTSATDPRTYSPDDVRRKVSVFTAVFDPTGDFPAAYLHTPVNVTRALANRVLGTDYAPLPDMSYRWADDSFETLVRVPDDVLDGSTS